MYNRTVWNDFTIITPEKMNKIEDELVRLNEILDSINVRLNERQNSELVVSSHNQNMYAHKYLIDELNKKIEDLQRQVAELKSKKQSVKKVVQNDNN